MTLLEAPRLPNFPADLTQSRETREPATAPSSPLHPSVFSSCSLITGVIIRSIQVNAVLPSLSLFVPARIIADGVSGRCTFELSIRPERNRRDDHFSIQGNFLPPMTLLINRLAAATDRPKNLVAVNRIYGRARLMNRGNIRYREFSFPYLIPESRTN